MPIVSKAYFYAFCMYSLYSNRYITGCNGSNFTHIALLASKNCLEKCVKV